MSKGKLEKQRSVKSTTPTETSGITVQQGNLYSKIRDNANVIVLVLTFLSIFGGICVYYKNSSLQIYLARKQVYNPIYYQLDLGLREFYSSTDLFFRNKGRSPDPDECIRKAEILGTGLYQIKYIDEDIYKQIVDFMQRWADIPIKVLQYKNNPENRSNPNISDEQYLEYGKKMKYEFLSLREKISERIGIKE